MELRALGSTGLRVSPLGIGTTKFGRNEGVKYPTPFDLPSDAEIEGLLDAARAAGVNLIDTAPAYGTSEARLGELLSDRERWVIVTKAGERFESGESHFDYAPAAIEQSVEESLARLQTDWLDVVLLPSNGDDVAILRESGALEALNDLRSSGRIRAVGISTKGLEGGLLAVELCDVVMVTLNRDDRSQMPVVHAARKKGVGVLVKKPLASGHDVDPIQALTEISIEPGVSSVIVGTLNVGHFRDNCTAVGQAISADPSS